MKKILVVIAMAAVSLSAFAQGKVAFVNDATRLFVFDAAIKMKAADVALAGTSIDTFNAPLPSGVTLVAGLYGGTSAGGLTLQKSLVLNTAASLISPGRMASQSTTLSGVPGGVAQYFKVAVWDNAYASPEAAAAALSYSGQSAVFTAIPGTSISYPSIVPGGPSQSTWAAGNLVVGLVPEPTSAMIAGLGLASMLILRRKK